MVQPCDTSIFEVNREHIMFVTLLSPSSGHRFFIFENIEMKTQTFAKSDHELNSSSQGSIIIPSQRPKIPNG
jgi:hypothetical protein